MCVLSKKLSSILLCGSLLLTLVGNSCVYAENGAVDISGNVQDGEKLVDSNKENNSEDNENIDTDDEPEGFSFDSSAVKSLGASALGAGLVVGTDRVINSFSGSSKPKAESVYDTQ